MRSYSFRTLHVPESLSPIKEKYKIKYMLNILKEQFKIGDKIKITLTNDREVLGIIDNYSVNHIVIQLEQGKKVTLLERMIGMWEQVEENEIIENSTSEGKKLIEKKEEEVKEYIIDVERKNKEPETTTETIKPIDNITEKPHSEKSGLKIVGKVDLSKLEKKKRREEIKKAKAAYKNKSKEDKKQEQVAGNLNDLVKILKPELEKANEQTVPANGVLYRFFGDRFFGFIRDKFNYELYFNYREVIDKKLLNSLVGTATKVNIPVLFTLQKMGDKERAIFVQKPKKIKDILINAEELMGSNKYDSAMGLVKQILETYPDNYSANQLKEKIEKNRFRGGGSSYRKARKREYTRYYANANKAKVNKNYSKAIELFKLALDNNEKVESTIKDLAQTYLEVGEIQKGVELIEQNIDELSPSTTTYNFLDHYYTSAENYEKAIEYVDKNLDIINYRDKKTHSRLLTKKAFCFIQLKDFDEAEELLEEAISLQKDNSYATNLLTALTSASTSGDYQEVDKLIEETEFASFGRGLSNQIKDIIDKYDEYRGIPATLVESGEFYNKKTLFTIRNLIDKAGRARPKERADYLLTEAKLLQELEPESDEIKSVLARYCKAMSQNHIAENSQPDVIRNYLLEGFSLEEEWSKISTNVSMYLWSFKASYSDLLTDRPPSIDSLLSDLPFEEKEQLWDAIINTFLSNRVVAAKLIERIYSKSSIRNKSIDFLKRQSFLTGNTYPDLQQYIKTWDKVIQKRERETRRWFASIKALTNLETIEMITNQLQSTLLEAKADWLPQIDNFRLNIIAVDISDLLTRYLKLLTYDDKERAYNQLKAEITQLSNEIEEQPTKLSYDGFLPLLDRVIIALAKSFKGVLEASTPRLSVRVLSSNNIIETGNIVPFKIALANDKQCSPIGQLEITIEENENISFPVQKVSLEESLKGGEEKVIELSIKVSDKVMSERATTIKLETSYQIRGKEEKVIKYHELALRLYSEDEFAIISNPYAPLADGGPVEDNSMFYGRNEFIKNITKAILSADSKQIIIYGQKRSGKSSVLFHLKEALDAETNQAFCINFSLGDIVEDLDTNTFYHKILSLIGETLEDLEFEGESVPEFNAPSLSDFEQNVAADLFRKSLKRFKRSCRKTEGWENRKLVVMIDEFTYLYTAILKKQVSDNIMQQWKAITQNKDSRFSVVLVGQDVVPKFKAMYPNPFGVIEDKRLTYLNPIDAKALIEKPIWDESRNQSRFLGSAINRILDYTSCNPYYIQIFCARLVDYLNKKKINEVTEVEVKLIADSFISGEQSLTADKFDNLLTAGDADLEAIPLEDTIQILKQIADNSRNIPMCARENILLKDKEYDNSILQDLMDREVIESPQSGYFKIKVKLFQEWLLIQ